MRKRIPVSELQFGMYIAELDRPWTDTPFVFQGFVLSTPKQLETLKKYCATVVINTAREEARGESRPGPAVGGTVYPEKASIEQEIAPARAAYGDSRMLMRDVLTTVRIGRALDAEQVRSAVTAMTESVLRNPQALLLLSQLRKHGEYNESHALDVSIYMITFGRFLGLEAEKIEFLGYLGLLQDVGKLRLPKELLQKRGRLNAEEFALARQHVAHSAEILGATAGLPPELPGAAALHHERHDGSGYPAGLRGAQIGLIGSIAGIADTYDALTVQRPHADPLSPSAAISLLYKARGGLFDPQLVEQFIRCIGIFPVGSLVQLNTGETGVVIAQHPVKRLQPRVMVIRDAAGHPLRPQKLLDLSRSPRASANEPYRILATLEAGSVPFDPEEMFLR
jgi:HD-GYP domain-containing protein (c-di-GMP phosphodiesterase class II)